ncbi:microtubule-binding protein MIP-T3-domain-containing protein, partial [Pavlovales sp. CCMP2436]
MEPEATNAFLQLLARAATDPNVDRNAAIARVLGGESTAPRPPVRQKEPAAPPPAAPAAPEPAPLPMLAPAAPQPTPMPEPPNASALNTFQSEMPALDDGGGGGKAERPRTARRQPPKVSSNVVKVEQSASKGAAETAAIKNIITEGAAADDDDDDGIEFVNEAGDKTSAAGLLRDEAGEGHTKIVKDILETQKEMELANRTENKLGVDGGESKGGGGIILGKKKTGAGGRDGAERQRTKDEIATLRTDIQLLCQSTNPLGKSLEYVHEDLEAMTRELEHWRSLHAKNKAKIHEATLEVDAGVKQLDTSLE